MPELSMSDGATRRSSAHAEQAAQISREMVQLMRRVSGRGPTKARTTIGRDHVLTMFQDTLTQGERNLVQNGHRDQVEALRSAYQDLIRDEASSMIERILDRRVIGFMSDNHFDPDMAAEVFILDPREEPAGSTPQEAEHVADQR
jgi:uncharacterized protein YbcI